MDKRKQQQHTDYFYLIKKYRQWFYGIGYKSTEPVEILAFNKNNHGEYFFQGTLPAENEILYIQC